MQERVLLQTARTYSADIPRGAWARPRRREAAGGSCHWVVLGDPGASQHTPRVSGAPRVASSPVKPPYEHDGDNRGGGRGRGRTGGRTGGGRSARCPHHPPQPRTRVLLHVIEAALPVQRQQHGAARLQRRLHEVHGLGAAPGDAQHRDGADEAAVIGLRRQRAAVRARSCRPAPRPVQALPARRPRGRGSCPPAPPGSRASVPHRSQAAARPPDTTPPWWRTATQRRRRREGPGRAAPPAPPRRQPRRYLPSPAVPLAPEHHGGGTPCCGETANQEQRTAGGRNRRAGPAERRMRPGAR